MDLGRVESLFFGLKQECKLELLRLLELSLAAWPKREHKRGSWTLWGAGCSSAHQNLSISQHTFGPIRQELGNFAWNGTNLLVLHKVLVGKMADDQADCKVEREETVWHRFPPQLLCNCFLVEDLANGTVHDEHREGLVGRLEVRRIRTNSCKRQNIAEIKCDNLYKL